MIMEMLSVFVLVSMTKNCWLLKRVQTSTFLSELRIAMFMHAMASSKASGEKEEGFEQVDYVEEFAYRSTKQLFDEGFIKATKEKKVDFDF